MSLKNSVLEFFSAPYPLWNNDLTGQLVDETIARLNCPYSLTNSILSDVSIKESTLPINGTAINVVIPSIELKEFYDSHGLEVLPVGYLFDAALVQFHEALSTFSKVLPVELFINRIVKSIQFLASYDLETDVSYSHPDVPFSIFISVCKTPSPVSALRVAESILHEAMHLLLTLTEKVLPIVKHGSKAVFYSPWRGEPRPVRGVLHGLFVFKAILEFYKALNGISNDLVTDKFINNRIINIQKEILELSGFDNADGLTFEGQILAHNLL